MRVGLVLSVLLAACAAAPDRADSIALATAIASRDDVLATRLAPAPGTWLREREGLTWRDDASAAAGTEHELSARLPLLADQPFEVTAGASGDAGVRLTPRGAAPAGVRDAEGRVVYDGAWPDADLMFVAEPERVEWLVLLRRPGAEVVLAWDVDLIGALADVRNDRAGGLVFTDRRGEERLRMPRPFALDAEGRRRSATVSFDGRTLEVRLDARGLTEPVLLDPALESGVWERVIVPPGARDLHAVAFDSTRNRLVLFGGRADAGVSNETWEWDGTAWALRSTAGPPARQAHAMAFDAARGRTVLFGGRAATGGASDQLGDTWEWDGTTWTLRASSGPSPREYHAMAYDAFRGRVVLFGGSASGYLGDTWEWDGTTWSRITPAGSSPSARNASSMAYDSTRHRVVLFGGQGWGGTRPIEVGDTWEWDGTAWTSVSTSGPPARMSHGMFYDTTRVRTVVFGGSRFSAEQADLWEWDGATWTLRAATTAVGARDIMGMAYDTARHVGVLVGGSVGIRRFGDTWEWDGSSFTPRSAEGPGPLWSHAMAYDSGRARTVLFGGRRGVTDMVAETWELDGSAWLPRAVTGPPARHSAAMAYDSARARTVLFGGVPLSTSTWVWDGTTWTEAATTGPSARSALAMAYDSARGRVVMFGGVVGSYEVGDTWEWDGSTWTEVAMGGTAPARRQGHSMAYDARRGVTVLNGGYWHSVPGCSSCVATFGDTWEWNGTVWAMRDNSRGDVGSAMAYDATRGRTVLFGGTWGRDPATYEWDGTAWLTLASTGPAPRYGHAMVFDTARRRTFLFGGYGFSSSVQDDTWAYHTRGAACTTGATCDTGFCTDGVCCEVATCGGGCARCDVAGSVGRCTPSDAACASDRFCDAGGACVPKRGLGEACSASRECLLGHCADGVCCDAACFGGCESCSSAGRCAPAAAGDPGVPSCAPYVCNGAVGTCPVSCTTDAGCASGLRCIGALCATPRANGFSCSADHDCASGFCTDGLCCNARCAGDCEYCALERAVGTCTIAVGDDPRGRCPGTGSCRALCAATGACAYPGATLACGSGGACIDAMTAMEPMHCDGSGGCVAGGTQTCTPFVCAAGACQTTCSSAGCAPGFVCASDMCVADAGVPDGGAADAGMNDAGPAADDGGVRDAGSGGDAGGGRDAGSGGDAGFAMDGGPADAASGRSDASLDAGVTAPSEGGCGCRVGSRAARWRTGLALIFGALALGARRRRRRRCG